MENERAQELAGEIVGLLTEIAGYSEPLAEEVD